MAENRLANLGRLIDMEDFAGAAGEAYRVALSDQTPDTLRAPLFRISRLADRLALNLAAQQQARLLFDALALALEPLERE